MQTPDYIILTPTAPFKLYALERFLNNVASFEPKPKEMVFCTEPEMVPHISKWEEKLEKQGIKLVIFTLEPEILNQFPKPDIKKLTYSREHLRKYFINSPFEWALWLDSDIIPEKNVFQVLFKIAQSEKYLVVANQYYLARTMGSPFPIIPIKGMGCTLTHRAACTFAKFQIACLDWNKEKKENINSEDMCLADDFWFFAMIQTSDRPIKNWTGWRGLKKGRFVSIWHLTGSDKFPDKFLEKISNVRSKKTAKFVRKSVKVK